MRADYVWEGLYKGAVLETDDSKLPQRLQDAKAAIDKRLQDLLLDHGGTREERQAISDALLGLNVLRGEVEMRSRNKAEQGGCRLGRRELP